MWQYIVAFLGSLVVAWFSVRWSARSRDKRALISLKSEISNNINICKANCTSVGSEIESLNKGEARITLFGQLQTVAWDTARSAIMLTNSKAYQTLEKAYTLVNFVNRHIQRIEELESGLFSATGKIQGVGQEHYVDLKEHMQEFDIPALIRAKDVIDKELSKYKWWHL